MSDLEAGDCDHHIQVEAEVEEAESSFGAEAFRPLLDHEGPEAAGSDVSDSVPTFFLDCLFLAPFCVQFGRSVPYLSTALPLLAEPLLFGQSQLVTFGPTMS